jgi:prophage DNA circulation protein
MCEISIEFIETTAEVLNPTSAVSGAGLVASAVDTSHAVSLAVFLSEYTRLPYSIEMHAALTSLRATVDAVLSANALGDQDLATLLQESRSLTEDATVLLDAPQMLADKVQSIATGLKSALQSAKSLSPVSTLLRLATWVGGTRPDASTPSGAAKAANFYAVVKYTQKEGIGQAAQTVAESKYASYDDAVSAREQVTAQIDAQVERADDVGFASQTELRASLVQAVPGPDSDLPHIEKITRGSDTPSIVLAYEVYGDATREQEIVDRNKIKDPTYVPGGASIEVLSK